MKITYEIVKLKTGGYMAYSPEIKSAIVEGITEEDAVKKLISFAKLYIKRYPEFNTRILDLSN